MRPPAVIPAATTREHLRIAPPSARAARAAAAGAITLVRGLAQARVRSPSLHDRTNPSRGFILIKSGPFHCWRAAGIITYTFAVTNTGSSPETLTVVDPLLGGTIFSQANVAPEQGFRVYLQLRGRDERLHRDQ